MWLSPSDTTVIVTGCVPERIHDSHTDAPATPVELFYASLVVIWSHWPAVGPRSTGRLGAADVPLVAAGVVVADLLLAVGSARVLFVRDREAWERQTGERDWLVWRVIAAGPIPGIGILLILGSIA